ncbi:MAG: BON domain-containing protein [Fibrobacterota bacterium]
MSLRKKIIYGVSMVFLIASVSAAEKEIEDSRISDAVRNDLWLDKAVSSHNLDVETEDGIVMLSGSVDNILAESRAVKIARSIKGVRSVVEKITVRPVNRPDEKIKSDVIAALVIDPVTESYETTVSVEDGKVRLTGTVESWAEKKLCERVAKSVSGVKSIENDIDINYQADREDSEIKSEIERRLTNDPYVYAALINVSVEDGIVELSGTVGSASQKSMAYNNAWVNGVKTVKQDNLEVKWWAEDKIRRDSKTVIKDDSKIKNAVKDALYYDPRTLSYDIKVSVENGVATLRGDVASLRSKNSAEEDAENTTGVIAVNNLINVRAGLVEDKRIAQQVREAILWNPVLERHKVDVMVRNGKVYIYGSVDSYFEKLEATEAASSVNGVGAIDNNIEVDYSGWAWKEDGEIKSEIEDEYYWSWDVDEDDITVSVDNGIVTLSGEVDSWGEAEAAIENAFDGGARIVEVNFSVDGKKIYSPKYDYRTYFYKYDESYFSDMTG